MAKDRLDRLRRLWQRLVSWRRAAAPPLRLRNPLFSDAQWQIYRALSLAADGWAVVFAKVQVAELFDVVARLDRRAYSQKLRNCRLDFLLCRPEGLQPLVAVLIDPGNSPSEGAAGRGKEERLVERLLEQTGLALVRVRATDPLHPQKLRRQLREAIAATRRRVRKVQTPSPAPRAPAAAPPAAVSRKVAAADRAAAADKDQDNADEGPPICPDCQVAMVVRPRTVSQRANWRFYRCPNYPSCQHTWLVID